MKIDSCYRSKGTFEGHEFNNIVVVCSTPVNSNYGWGNRYKSITIKPKYVSEGYDPDEFLDETLKGCEVSFDYDEFQHPKKWNIVE